jgi:hypothetical protein
MELEAIQRRIAELHTALDQMEDKLEFYKKFVTSPNPRHRGIPFMAASEGFGSTQYDPYGQFRRGFSSLANDLGLGHMWEAARARGGWVVNISKAKRILFPDVPMHVPTAEHPKAPKVQHDPRRSEVAVIYLERALEKMRIDLDKLENTVTGDPSLFTLNDETDEIEDLSENLSTSFRRLYWSKIIN